MAMSFTHQRPARVAGVALLAGLVGAFVLAGCKPSEKSESQSRRKEGVITRIEAAHNRLAMKVRDEKNPGRFLEKEIEGTITPTTEIFINSARAELKDVQVNDRVTAIGHAKGDGDNLEIVAEELRIERSAAAEPAPARAAGESKPAPTAAAAPPQPAPAEQAPPSEPKPADAAASATPDAPKPTRPDVRSARIDLYMRLVEEFQRKRQELVVERDDLLKQGRTADDPTIRDLENKINRADESIAMIEEKAAEEANRAAGAPEAPKPPATQPAGN